MRQILLLTNFLICFSPVARAALPTYDAGILKAYAANPAQFEATHEEAYKVVEAQTIKFYDDFMTYYMQQMKITEPTTPIKVLTDFTTYFKTLPTPLLADMAHTRQNLIFSMALMSTTAIYQVTHHLPVTIAVPPSLPENAPMKMNATDAPKGVEPPAAEAQPGDQKRLAKLEDQLQSLRDAEQDRKRTEYILMGVAGLSLVLTVVSFFRR